MQVCVYTCAVVVESNTTANHHTLTTALTAAAPFSLLFSLSASPARYFFSGQLYDATTKSSISVDAYLFGGIWCVSL
jgi:hypothetical protein